MTSGDINESKQILQNVNNDRDLKFDDEIMETLFGNTLEISNQDEYEQWKNIAERLLTLEIFHSDISGNFINFEHL